MNDDVPWLVQEISDLLDAGQVGLYELVWVLHGRYPNAPAGDLLHICRPALDELLTDPRVKLGWYQWPEFGSALTASEADLDDHAFDDIGADGRYLAIERA